MKYTLLLTLLFTSIAFLSFDSAAVKPNDLGETPKKDIVRTDTGGLVFSLDSNQFNFGAVDNYEWITLIFYAKNTSNHPIVINRLATSCGCDWCSGPRKPILPGEIVPLRYSYDSHRVGVSLKTIYISYDSLYTVLRITMNVQKAFVHPDNGNHNIPAYIAEKPFDNPGLVKYIGLDASDYVPFY